MRNYTGQQLDETGLLFYNARYYDPTLARFISADSVVPGAAALTIWPSDATAASAWGRQANGLANPQALNRYSYVQNNPVNHTDPSGHYAVTGGIDKPYGGPGGSGPGSGPVSAPAPSVMVSVGTVVGGAGIAYLASEATQPDVPEAPDTGATDVEPTNTNPYTGPVDESVIVVDPHGNAIPVNQGEQLSGSPDGRYTQVRDSNGNPTGMRLDGSHKPASHPDPRAQVPHAHVPKVTHPDGTPWLPVKGPK